MNNQQTLDGRISEIDVAAERKARIFIISASIAIPLVVTILHYMPKVEAGTGSLRNFLNFLPTFNAVINGITTLVLIAAFVAILKKKIPLHKRLMTTALIMSVLFLLSYVSYHSTSEPARFPKDNPIRPIYIFVLYSHIILSAVIVPMVLISYSRGLARRFDRHKRIARWTLPMWLYVTITGVVVYLMISPYYGF